MQKPHANIPLGRLRKEVRADGIGKSQERAYGTGVGFCSVAVFGIGSVQNSSFITRELLSLLSPPL